MSGNTPRLALGEMIDGAEMDPMAVNAALEQIDAFTDICLKGQFVDTPPSSPADGDMYLVGGAPAGDWTGKAYKIVYRIAGAWRAYVPFNGLRAFVATTNAYIVYLNGQWIDSNALISANEVSIASAATCDLGAAASLFVQVTGTAAIASFGSGASLLRFVRFAQALTLTHNAVSLILPGAASIVTAAGDTAVFASDASGNWRCQSYSRASGQPVAANLQANALGLGMAPGNMLDITNNQNAISLAKLLNNSPGGVAQAVFNTSNGANDLYLGILGTGFASSGAFQASYGYVNATSGLTLNCGAGAPMIFSRNSAEISRFAPDGSFLVGTAANGGWNNNAKAAIVDAGSGWALSLYRSAVFGACANFRVDNANSNLAEFNFNGANVGTVTTTGTATAYNTTSDARLKTVLADQGDYRAAIRALWVGDFAWKKTGAKGFGVLAQQAWEVMPHRLGITRPGDEDDAWHASAEPFGHLALWGVKDLYAMVEALAARVAALEAAHEAG